MQELTWHVPVLNRKISVQLLTEQELNHGLRESSLCEVLEYDNGENLTLYTGKDSFLYGQTNYFDESIEDIENWDEGFEKEKVLVPGTGYGYRFTSIEDARAFFKHIEMWFPSEDEPFGYVRLTPQEKNAFILNKELTIIPEQYKNHGDWQSLQLIDGRILLVNPYRDDKAHAKLYNTLDNYLTKKKDYEGFLDYLENNP